MCRHAPGSTHAGTSYVILGAGNVGTDIYATAIIIIVVSISFPIIHAFLTGLAPCVVTAIALWAGCANIAAAPLGATGKAKVYGMRVVVIRTGVHGILQRIIMRFAIIILIIALILHITIKANCGFRFIAIVSIAGVGV